MALQLRRHGIRHVRPLLGGYYEWKELGFPLQDVINDEGSGRELNAITTDGAA